MLTIGIIAGLIAMLCWGIADFLQAIIIKRVGSSKTMVMSNVLSVILTLPLFILFVSKGHLLIDLTSIFLIIGACVIDVIAVIAFMKSFEIGEICIVTPISASYSFISVILAILFLGERLPGAKLIAIVVIIAGIFLTSTDMKKFRLKAEKGVVESIVAMIGWGVFFFIIGLAMRQLHSAFPGAGLWDIPGTIFFFTTLINGTLLASYGFIMKGIPGKKEIRQNILFLVVNFFLYSLAWISVNYGIAQELISIVTPVSSLYPALTVILAVIFFKEKTAPSQRIGIFLTLFGIFLISL